MISLLMIFTVFLLQCTEIFAQNRLTNFKAIDLNGKEVTISDGGTGNKTLVGFAFSQKAQEDLESWIQPVYDEFIDENSLASMVYDVDVYLVIVFNSLNSNFRKKVERELKENVFIEFYDNVLLCDEKSTSIKTKLNIENDAEPSLFALDRNGIIKEQSMGRYSEKKMEKLSRHLEIE